MGDMTASDRYEQGRPEREPYVNRAYQCSELTLPHLFPRQQYTPSNPFTGGFQNTGGRSVSYLANALMLTGFPPNVEVLKMEAEPQLARAIEDDEITKDEVEDAFYVYAHQLAQEVDATGLRGAYVEANKHKLVAGTVLFRLGEKGWPRYFPLDTFVQQLDGSGNLMDITICESISERALPKSALDALKRAKKSSKSLYVVSQGNVYSPTKINNPADYSLYTCVHREAEDDDDPETYKFHVWQEIESEVIENSYRTYTQDELPYISMTYNHVCGESYGRGRAEEYFGHLTSLEGITEALVEAVAALSKFLVFVPETSGVDIDLLAKSRSGDILVGHGEQIHALQFDKAADLNFGYQLWIQLRDEITRDFGLQSVVRDSERTTAEEIRMLRQEVDRGLGGMYSVAAFKEHRPIFYRLMNRIESRGEAPIVNTKSGGKQLVKPRIITGIEALGRDNDAMRLRGFYQDASLMGPGVLSVLKIRENMGALADAWGLNPRKLLMKREEIAEQQKAIQFSQLAQQVGSKAVDVLGNIVENRASNGVAPTPQMNGVAGA